MDYNHGLDKARARENLSNILPGAEVGEGECGGGGHLLKLTKLEHFFI